MHKIGRPCVVVDCGSCLTCDAISAQGALTAGAIAPGLPVIRAGLRSAVPHLQTSLDEATQLLGHGELPTGRSTAEGLVLGIVQALAATAEGLGTCWIGSFDQDACRMVLGVPETAWIIELLPIGYPAGPPKTEKPRKDFDSVVCWDKFE